MSDTLVKSEGEVDQKNVFESYEEKDYLRLIEFGPPGTGKTVFIGSGAGDPRVTPGLIIDVEGGVMSIRSKCIRLENLYDLWGGTKTIERPDIRQHPDINSKFVVYKPKTWQEMEDIVALINDPGDKFNIYKSVTVDSLSELNYLNLNSILKAEVLKNPRRDKQMYELQDYGKSANQLRMLVRVFRDMPIHSFYTAFANHLVNNAGQTTDITPSLVGKLAFELPGLVDIVGYLRITRQNGENVREMLWQPDSTLRAKDRSEGGKLGISMVNPNLPEVLDKLGIK